MAASSAELEADARSGGAQVETEIEIRRPPPEVFAYVTTPALWSTWHPATVAVRDVPQRPLTTGETAVEVISVAGRRGEATWTVRACTPPRSWEIVTDNAQGSARIVYRLTPVAGGTRFHRTLYFRSKRWPWRALDSTLMRWVLVRQSARALANLKAVLEG